MDIEMTAGENTTPDAGESTKKSFDELIEGQYRREYGEKVEAIVKNRLKNHADVKQKLSDITDLLSKAGSELGVESDDPRQIIEALVAKREEANSEVKGTNPAEEKEGEGLSSIDDATVQRVKALAETVREVKELYPDFDITKELKDPEFTALLRICQNDPRRAYEMKYHDRIITNAMHYAVSLTEQKIADNMIKRTARPSENAVSGSSAVMIATDPKSLTKAQRSDIKKRVRRGEKIFWN